MEQPDLRSRLAQIGSPITPSPMQPIVQGSIIVSLKPGHAWPQGCGAVWGSPPDQ
jgi:hypothetical protein